MVVDLIPQLAALCQLVIVVAEGLDVLLVVVHVVDVGLHVVVAAGINAGAGGIGGLGGQVHGAQHVVVLGAAVAVPRLIERAPADERGVVEIALDLLQPLGQHAEHGLGAGVIQAPVGELAPHQVAQAVAVIEEALLEDLLMQARAIEAAGHGQFDVAHQRGVAGRGVDAVGVEALVEHRALEDGLAVDQEAVAVQAHGAQARVAVDNVLAVGERQVVQAAAADLPQVHLGQRQRQLCATAGALDGRLAHGPALVAGLHAQRARAAKARVDPQRALVHVGVELDVFYMGLGRELQPHRLPDAGGAGVVASMREEQLALLAAGDERVALVVLGVDGQDVLACLHRVGHVKAEGHIAALVRAHGAAVDERLARVVDRAEVQHDAACGLRLGQRERAAVPNALHEVLVADAGQLALRAKGHRDASGQLGVRRLQAAGLAGAAVVEFERPLAVEVHPRVAAELGLGMFGTGNGIHQQKPPYEWAGGARRHYVHYRFAGGAKQ